VPLANGRYLANALPHGRLEVIGGAGHLVLLDDPSSGAPAIEAFLAS
jgi:pimeloyl-ACP methyl ester carboxylesterase